MNGNRRGVWVDSIEGWREWPASFSERVSALSPGKAVPAKANKKRTPPGGGEGGGGDGLGLG